MTAKVSFDREVCKGCGLCTLVCPRGIVVLEQGAVNSKGYHVAVVSRPEECIACGCCARMCPDSAITVEKQ
ncbi:4Fe-4S dicluster domain-containing protein [Lawsonibacter celer]|jgi:2-oxoglutarate ferredoxin oxidoreductase subunit delta|uniref:4Fe-4S dicluster domain-containing protein n=1 Tax=Lawsonibacter celer TaxID=2986526 RepID=UPI0016455A8D|nr:4Fe-4S dicluster domain-containing protein [Lawsonibacter celer]